MTLARLQFGLLAGVAATCLMSIFAAQILFGGALLCGVIRWAAGQTAPEPLAAGAPMLAFSVWTLLAASFSGDPVASHEDAKKLVLFALLYLFVDSLAHRDRRDRALDAALLGGAVLSSGALVEWALLGFDTLNNRPRSFVGHYMTASGLFMGVAVLSAARLVFARGAWPTLPRSDLKRLLALLAGLLALAGMRHLGLFALEAERLFVALLSTAALALAFGAEKRDPEAGRWLAALALPLSLLALLVSRTRSAWLGTLAGLVLIAVLRAPKLLYLLGALLLALLVVRPAPLIERLTLSDASSVDRFYMWRAGLDMIADRPIFGHGPGRVLEVYPRYRWSEAPNQNAPHLHDNLLQVAAERGLPCVAWWLWLLVVLARDAWKEARGPALMAGASSLAMLLSLLVSGLFEYNFGDSEVFMFFLLLASLPYAARRERRLAIG